jgi:hypothetical protein
VIPTRKEFAEKSEEQIRILKSYESEITRFRAMQEDHNEIIRRYDEVISDKASKIAMTELRHEVNKLIDRSTALVHKCQEDNK